MRSRSRIVRRPIRAIEEIERIARQLNEGPNLVKVGLPKGSNDYPDGTSLIMVGATHEFGSEARRVPQRSYLRTTLSERRKEYIKILKKLSKKIISGEMTKEHALGLLGLKVQTDVRDKITDIKEPPLVVRVGGNPLVDTGHLRQSIVYKVGNRDDD